jgi:hypothetical protein
MRLRPLGLRLVAVSGACHHTRPATVQVPRWLMRSLNPQEPYTILNPKPNAPQRTALQSLRPQGCVRSLEDGWMQGLGFRL